LEVAFVAVKNGRIERIYRNENRSYSSGVSKVNNVEFKIEDVDQDTTLTFIPALNQYYKVQLVVDSSREVQVKGWFLDSEATVNVSSKLRLDSERLNYLKKTSLEWDYTLKSSVKIIQSGIDDIVGYDIES
jgi:hypothetical protein